MADIHLLGLFNNVEPTADAIDRLHKLGVSDLPGLVKFAIQHDLISLS